MRLTIAALISLFLAAPLAAQSPYPLEPSPVLSIRTLEPTPKLGGYISFRATERNDSTGFLINRGRLTAMAAPRPWLAIRIQGDFSSNQIGKLRADSTTAGFTLTDAYVQLTPTDSEWRHPKISPSLIVGQFKQPFSLEYLTSFAYLKTANRSQAVDRLSPKRDIGAMGQVRITRLVTIAGAVTNGEGANATSNPNGHELVMSRLTLSPIHGLALAAKVGNEADDHLWGYDGRLLWHHLTLEGEDVHRKHPLSATSALDAGGGYVLAAYKVFPWLEPVYKWDRYWETRTTGVSSSFLHSTWNTLGVNVLSRQESFRLQLDWVIKAERPTPVRNDEALAQVIANF